MLKDFRLLSVAAAIACAATFAVPAFAEEEEAYSLTLGEDGFQPAKLSVKAGVKIKLVVFNARTVPAEFESSDLQREKVIAAGASTVVYVGPLEPGRYGIFDDFKPSTTGDIIAK